jgi:hypothetical protein
MVAFGQSNRPKIEVQGGKPGYRERSNVSHTNTPAAPLWSLSIAQVTDFPGLPSLRNSPSPRRYRPGNAVYSRPAPAESLIPRGGVSLLNAFPPLPCSVA